MKLRALGFLLPCVSLGCSSGGDPSIVTGDAADESELVAERELTGVELEPGTLSLTFDDGPGDRTSELADFLADQGIHATFFINGKNVPGRQRHVDTVVGRGHLLANHTQNHLKLTKLTGATLLSEIAETDAVIAGAQPSGPWLLRAPFGAWNGRIAAEVNATDMSKYVGSIFWDMGGELTDHGAADWACWGQHVDVDACADLYMEEITSRKRGIVLMHDVHSKTVDLAKILVPRLVERGFKFTSLLDVPSIKRAVAASTTTPASPGACFSATLGESVEDSGCVQSRENRSWYRCSDREWVRIAGPDGSCTSQRSLEP